MSVEATTSHSSLDRTSMGTCRTSRQRLCATVSLCTQRMRRLAPRTSRSVVCTAVQSARPTVQLGSQTLHGALGSRQEQCTMERAKVD